MTAIKLIAACALFAAASAASAASAADQWSGSDKPKHIAASAISAVIVESLFAETLSPAQRFGLAMVPGIAKEIFDMRRGGSGFSGKDLAADALGVGLGMALHGLVIRPNYVGFQLKF